jgi:hypothetical protein
MTLDLTCQSCDTSFEVDLTELVDEPQIQCPTCNARAPLNAADGLASALDELLAHVSRLRPRFQLLLEVDSDDLPPQYEHDRARSALAGEEDEDSEESEDDEEPDDADDSERGVED